MIEKVLPLVTLENKEDAKIIGELLIKNGFNSAEVTYRTGAATDVIKILSKLKNFSVGAGTITSLEQMNEAIDAGAEFIITPGINIPVIEESINRNIDVYPGVVTPSEIEVCRKYGLNTLKLFPCGVFGGIDLLKSYQGPYYDFNFIPTGGVNLNNAEEFLGLKNVVSIGGSFILNDEYIKNKDWVSLDNHLKKISDKLYKYF